jgi:predicted ester cyclase
MPNPTAKTFTDPAALEAQRETARALLARPLDVAVYREIRDLWKAHSIAEDNRDLEGLIATLTPDCVYEVVTSGHTWHGHDGARRFYTELLSAFPDVQFYLSNIVIGPQGVCEEATLVATHRADWQGLAATGQKVELQVVIFFPWDPERKKFRGERVYVDRKR